MPSQPGAMRTSTNASAYGRPSARRALHHRQPFFAAERRVNFKAAVWRGRGFAEQRRAGGVQLGGQCVRRSGFF